MFVRMRQWTTHAGEWDRFVSRLEHEAFEGMRTSDGFKRMIVTGDPMSNAVVTITIWESEAKERAYEVERAHGFQDLVKDLVAGTPETLAYPVVSDREA